MKEKMKNFVPSSLRRLVKIRPRYAFVAVKILITVIALMFLVRIVDAGRFMEQLSTVSLTFLLMTLVIFVFQVVLVGYRWHWIVRVIHDDESVIPPESSFLRIVFTAQFLMQMMPFAAGDAVRIYFLREEGASLSVAIRSTLLDRGIAALVLFTLIVPVTALSSKLFQGVSSYIDATKVFLLFALLCLAIAMSVADRIRSLVSNFRVLRILADTLLDLRNIALRPRGALPIITMSLLVHFLSVVGFYLIAQGQGLPLDFADTMIMVPLIVLVAMIPIAVGGWGVREAFVVSLLGTVGISAEASLLLSVIYGVLMLIASLPGAATLFFLRQKD